MRRIYFGIAIFTIMISIVIAGTHTVKTEVSEILSMIKNVEYAAMSNDTNTAIRLSNELEAKWVEYEDSLSMYINHADICNVGLTLASLSPFLEEDEKAEFKAMLNQARTQLIHLSSMENVEYD